MKNILFIILFVAFAHATYLVEDESISKDIVRNVFSSIKFIDFYQGKIKDGYKWDFERVLDCGKSLFQVQVEMKKKKNIIIIVVDYNIKKHEIIKIGMLE